MGVSVSAATAILLVAAMMSFGMVYSAQDSAQTSYIEAQSSMADRLNDILMTDLEINTAISVYDGPVFQYSRITMTNTGSTPIDMDNMRLMVNGEFRSYIYSFLGGGGYSLWLPGEVIVLTIGQEFFVDESYRIWAITANGVTDVLVYGGS